MGDKTRRAFMTGLGTVAAAGVAGVAGGRTELGDTDVVPVTASMDLLGVTDGDGYHIPRIGVRLDAPAPEQVVVSIAVVVDGDVVDRLGADIPAGGRTVIIDGQRADVDRTPAVRYELGDVRRGTDTQ